MVGEGLLICKHLLLTHLRDCKSKHFLLSAANAISCFTLVKSNATGPSSTISLPAAALKKKSESLPFGHKKN